jgi:hypothetical protein
MMSDIGDLSTFWPTRPGPVPRLAPGRPSWQVARLPRRTSGRTLTALGLLLAFGCATVKPPLPPPADVPPLTRVAVEEPAIELWLEDSSQVPPAEAEKALREARAALDAALAVVRTDPDPQAFLLVRERAVAVTSDRETQQGLATAGLVIAVVALAVLVVVAIVVGAKGGGSKGSSAPSAASGGPAPAPPRSAAPAAAPPVARAAPPPSVPSPPAASLPAAPGPATAPPLAPPAPASGAPAPAPPRTGAPSEAPSTAVPPPGTVRPAPPRAVPGPAPAPPRPGAVPPAAPYPRLPPPPPPLAPPGPLPYPPSFAYPPAAPWPYPWVDADAYFQLAMQLAFDLPVSPPTDAPGTVGGALPEPEPAGGYASPSHPFPAWASLDLEQRGFWDGDETLLDLALADARTGEVLWSTTVRARKDPRERAAVAALVREALRSAPFLRPAP